MEVGVQCGRGAVWKVWSGVGVVCGGLKCGIVG